MIPKSQTTAYSRCGTFSQAELTDKWVLTRKVGVGLPAGDRRTAGDALDGLLELSRSEESRARQLACKNLCTCHVRADDDRVWTRLLELVEDPDPWSAAT